MKALNATEAKREFGDVLLKAQSSPVHINKNGKPIAVVISSEEYVKLQEIKQQQLKVAIKEGMDDFKSGRIENGKQVMDNLRKRIS